MSVAPDRMCVVIARTRHKMMQVELREAVNRGAKFIEVRLDFLVKAVDFKRLQPYKACEWMATYRRPADGGRFPGTETERQTLLRQAIVSGAFEWVDLETDIAETIRRFGKVKRVISYHNMEETPADLDAIYDKMLKQDGDVYKIAVMARTADDCKRIIELQKRAPKPTVAFCMGDLGLPTRFSALKFNAPWIYAAFNKERGIAPGLPSIDDFRTIFPIYSIGPDTKFFALLGDPVGHSFSPVIHNHMLRRSHVDGFYMPIRTPDGSLSKMIEAMRSIPIDGYSVTIPHKEGAALVAREYADTVKKVRAANTLLSRPNGIWHAENTDYTAALESIQEYVKKRAEEQKATVPAMNSLFVLILGAGGAARAIAYALHHAGAHVTITSRTNEKSQALAAELGCKTCDWVARHSSPRCDIVVNCTPVGMHPNVNDSPLHAGFLQPGMTVFDTVYNPEHTLLIRDAEARGCGVITGIDMFVRQAAMQFELFTGIKPSLDEMRDLMRKAMSPLTRAMDEVSSISGGFVMSRPAEPESESEDDGE